MRISLIVFCVRVCVFHELPLNVRVPYPRHGRPTHNAFVMDRLIVDTELTMKDLMFLYLFIIY